MTFTHYIALGDSISIDVYPAHDAQARYAGQATTDKLGAASLLYKNDDRLWPEFKGRDLRSLYHGIVFDNYTSDGATTETLLRQVERVSASDQPTLVTVTIGGNDLLGVLGSRGANPVPAIAGRMRTAVTRVLEQRPRATILLSTVYDPSDGTHRLPGVGGGLEREAEWLKQYQDELRGFASTDQRLRLADIHQHFLGHGLTAAERDRWYLQESIIEPNARGASEVRRVWLETLRPPV
ncbi:MAG TPA: SGNH/GDSL hydrolase family protein [Thermoanaerobaculia bacterium]